jgi:hypothetical protein
MMTKKYYQGLIGDVMDSITQITCDLKTKEYHEFLILLIEEIEEKIEILDEENIEEEYVENDSEKFSEYDD